MKLFTVVTICRNAEKTISDAIESVLNQSFKDYEYIVIDGDSSDKTYDIVTSFDNSFISQGIKYTHISEKDDGIWDAMNKGIQKASGKWIIFINADDKLHDNNVLKTVSELDIDSYDVVYGDVMWVMQSNTYLGKARDIEDIRLYMPFCHQGTFTKTDIMKKYMFDKKYIVADYNFFLSLYMDKGKFYKTDIIIADYSREGWSNQNKYRTYLGVVDVKHDHGLINKNTVKQKLKNLYFFGLLGGVIRNCIVLLYGWTRNSQEDQTITPAINNKYGIFRFAYIK